MSHPPHRPAPGHRHGPTVALALGGGGARGLAHIHVAEVLDEMGVRPVAVAGSSIGALIGAGMAAGMSGRDIREHARAVLGSAAEVAGRMWKARPGSVADFVNGGFRIGQFNVERILRAFMPELPETFEELKVPLLVTATDFFGHKLAVLHEGGLFSALAASAAIPAVFRPVHREGVLYIDGGIYNPVPFDLILGRADITIAVDVVGAPTDVTGRRPTATDLMFGATQLMMQSIIAGKLAQSRPDIFLRPPVSTFRVLDFLKIDAVLADSAAIREDLKRALDAAFAEYHARGL